MNYFDNLIALVMIPICIFLIIFVSFAILDNLEFKAYCEQNAPEDFILIDHTHSPLLFGFSGTGSCKYESIEKPIICINFYRDSKVHGRILTDRNCPKKAVA